MRRILSRICCMKYVDKVRKNIMHNEVKESFAAYCPYLRLVYKRYLS
jgi:hypothetical protein